MTEEQIQQMYKFDLAVFRSERVFYTHTQALEINFDDEDVCEVSNYLLEYHQTSFLRDYSNRYWWVNELEKLYQAAMSLSDEEKELVTLYMYLTDILNKKLLTSFIVLRWLLAND